MLVFIIDKIVMWIIRYYDVLFGVQSMDVFFFILLFLLYSIEWFILYSSDFLSLFMVFFVGYLFVSDDKCCKIIVYFLCVICI